MVLRITSLSFYAIKIIKNAKNGYVHSVYRNTINIMVNGRLLAIQTSGSPLSPISLISDLNTFEHLSIKPDDELSFDITGAKVYDLAAKEMIAHRTRHELYRKFFYIIRASEVSGYNLIFQMSEKVDHDLVLSAAENKIHEANKLYQKERYQEAADKLCELIGLGSGLTPSGDDFLCGILAGLHIQGILGTEFSNYLHASVEKNIHRTNEISKEFLHCALDGHFSLAVNDLWNNPSEDQISQSFHAIGHSSGIDTLCGIYFLFFLME